MPRRDPPSNRKDTDAIKVVHKQKHNFSILYHPVLDDYGAELKTHGLATYWALHRCADNTDGTCYPSHQWIAERTGQSIASVKRSLKHLAQLGLIRITMRRPRTSIYRILDVPRRQGNSQEGAIDLPTSNSSEGPINRSQGAINSSEGAIEQLSVSYELDVVELDSPNYTHPTTPPPTPSASDCESLVMAPMSADVVEVEETVAIAQGEEAETTDGIMASAGVTPFDTFADAYPYHQGRRKAKAEWDRQQLDATLPDILAALSVTRRDALPKWPHVYLENKGWLDARLGVTGGRPYKDWDEPERPRCTIRDCPNPPEPTLSDTKCEMHATATINEEASRVIRALKACHSDATIDELESAIWGEVEHYHKNGDKQAVMDLCTCCYQSIGEGLYVEFLAQQIARVVAEYRAKPKPRMAVMN